MLHLRFRGESREFPLEELGVTPASDDHEIMSAVATRLEATPEDFRGYVVEREPTGAMTLRPEATFG